MAVAVAARRATPLVLFFLVSTSLLAADASAAAAAVPGPGANSSSFLLAAEQTQRKDPLDGLMYYTGGWNISDEHYWASVGFTAAPVFAAAGVWFVVFGIGLFIAGCCFCCCPSSGGGDSYSRACLFVSLVLLLVCRVRRAVRRAGPVPRQHGGDGGLRGAAVGRHGGHPAGLHGLPGDRQGRRRGAHHAARRRQGEDRRRRAQGGRGLRRARRPHGQQRRQNPRRFGDSKEGSDRCFGGDANPCFSWPRVLAVWIGVDCLRAGVPGVDPGCRDVCTVRYFSPPAQRGGRHVRGDGRVGAAPAGAHGAGRHPAVRGHGRGERGAGPGQGGELPAGGRAQRRAHQRLQPRLPAAGPAAAQLQPVRPAGAAALQPLHGRPPRPRVRAGRAAPRRRRRAAGVAALRVPRLLLQRGGVRDPGACHAVHVRAARRRGRRQLRAVPLRPRPGGAGGLHVREGDVPVHRRRPLPGPQPVQRPGVPGPARRRRRRDAGGAALGRALAGAAAEERGQGDPAAGLVALQVSCGGEGVPQEPGEAVHVKLDYSITC